IMAQEQGYQVDKKEFEKMMEKQQKQSGKKVTDQLDHFELDESIQTEFSGYQELETVSEIRALIHENKLQKIVPAGQTCWIIVRKSPYFIVGGGQVPDEGWIIIGSHKTKISQLRYINGRIAAEIKAPVDIKQGDTITCIVDKEWRDNAMKNHTGTHLLQAALMQILGKQIKQSGSLVHPDYLRFDFTYHENVTLEDIKKIEDLVNEKIRQNIPIRIEYTTMSDAVKQGALAFFGDKYNPEKVRMVDINGFSVELCGGTHVPATGMIGAFKIIEVTALSAGHRRIVALTGPRAIELFQQTYNTIKTLSQEFKVKREEVLDTVLKQKEQINALQQEVKALKKLVWHAQLPIWEQQIKTIKDLPFLLVVLDQFENEQLREIANTLAQKQPGFYFVISSHDNRSIFLGHLSAQFITYLNLKNFASWLKEKHSLQSGISNNTIQGGGGKFDPNLGEQMKEWLIKHVGKE
ncbi:MAG: alanine--tRNA ligase-related protein, partial [bacterium]|nr:alanine--tRNA ligase-related protein [bacterium]